LRVILPEVLSFSAFEVRRKSLANHYTKRCQVKPVGTNIYSVCNSCYEYENRNTIYHKGESHGKRYKKAENASNADEGRKDAEGYANERREKRLLI